MNIDWLMERLTSCEDRQALIWRDRHSTYAELVRNVERWRVILAEQNCPPGSVVGVIGDFSPEICGLLLTLMERNCVIVPLSAAATTSHREFLDTAEVQIVFEFSPDDSYQIQHRDVTVTNTLTLELIATGDAGLVLFSSGSTGKPKAALHNFAKLVEKFRTQRPSLRTLVFLLFDHIGGLNTFLHTISNGGTMVITRDRNPDEICRLIADHRVELLPTSPTFLRLLLISEAWRQHDLTSLTLITYGTEVMPESTLTRLNQVFPGVRFQQTYGLSELGIMRSRSKESGSLWVQVGGEGFETQIVDGVLWIRAASAMIGYLNAPSPFTSDGWFITGDLVETDGDYLRIKGRVSEIINVGGEKICPADVESVVQQMDGVDEVAVAAEPNLITGQTVTARVKLSTTETLPEFRRRMREFCRSRLRANQIPQKVLLVADEMHTLRFKKLRAVKS
ncbi:MAG: class I adenylate-forming enzyme family protein [Planctomycetota bacterium]